MSIEGGGKGKMWIILSWNGCGKSMAFRRRMDASIDLGLGRRAVYSASKGSDDDVGVV